MEHWEEMFRGNWDRFTMDVKRIAVTGDEVDLDDVLEREGQAILESIKASFARKTPS